MWVRRAAIANWGAWGAPTWMWRWTNPLQCVTSAVQEESGGLVAPGARQTRPGTLGTESPSARSCIAQRHLNVGRATACDERHCRVKPATCRPCTAALCTPSVSGSDQVALSFGLVRWE